MRRLVVTPQTRNATIDRWFADERSRSQIHLDLKMQPEHLIELMKRYQQSFFLENLLELVARHPSADARVCSAILGFAPASSAVAHAVVMNPKVSKKTLVSIRDSSLPRLAEHAELALLRRELQSAPGRRFDELLSQYQGDTGISLGVRHFLATHPRTPTPLLRILSFDDADFIASAARDSLTSRGVPQD